MTRPSCLRHQIGSVWPWLVKVVLIPPKLLVSHPFSCMNRGSCIGISQGARKKQEEDEDVGVDTDADAVRAVNPPNAKAFPFHQRINFVVLVLDLRTVNSHRTTHAP